MELIDTHTHLYLPEFDDREQAVGRAFDAGVNKMMLPNVDLSTVEPMMALAAEHPGKMFMAKGLHPTEIKPGWRDVLDQILSMMDGSEEVKAIGEVGMDLYWDKTYESEQMKAFDEQLALAERQGLPVIIHCREALPQTLEVLKDHRGVAAIFHSFGGTAAEVDAIRRVGDYYFGINGVVTFKNCKVRDAIPEITLDRLLLETDSPYLAPVPYRGKRNESAYIVKVAEHIADCLAIPLYELASSTTGNATRVFGL